MKGGPSGTYHAIEVWRRSDSGGGVLAHEERRRALPMKLQRPLQERQRNCCDAADISDTAAGEEAGATSGRGRSRRTAVPPLCRETSVDDSRGVRGRCRRLLSGGGTRRTHTGPIPSAGRALLRHSSWHGLVRGVLRASAMESGPGRTAPSGERASAALAAAICAKCTSSTPLRTCEPTWGACASVRCDCASVLHVRCVSDVCL